MTVEQGVLPQPHIASPALPWQPWGMGSPWPAQTGGMGQAPSDMGAMPPATPQMAEQMAPNPKPPHPVMPPEEEPSPFDDECKSDEAKDRALQKLNALFNTYAEYRRSYVEPVWDDTYAAYHGVPPADISPYGSYYPIKEIFRQVEALKPEMLEMLFPWPEPFHFKPWREGKDFDDMAAAATGIIWYQLRCRKAVQQIQQWIDNTWVWGNSYLMVGWGKYDASLRKIARVCEPDGEGKVKTAWERKTEEKYSEGPVVRWLDHWSVYTDWREEDVNDSPAVFVVDRVTAEYLKSLVKEGKLDDKAVKAALEEGGGLKLEASDAPVSMRSRGETGQETPNKDGLYELRWAWTNDGWKYATINRKHMACGQRNHLSRVPIFCLRNYPQPGEHYGKGEPAVLIWDQMLLNEAGSAAMDASHYTCNPMYLVAKSEKKNWTLLSYKPGGVAFLDHIENAKPLPVQPVMPEWMEFVNFIRRNMQLTTGNTDEKQGLTKQRTATGIKLMQDAASMRSNHKVTLNLPIVEQLWAFLYDLNARFLDEEVALRIEGEDGRKIVSRYGNGDTFGPYVFEPSVDVKIEMPPDMTAPETLMQKAITFYQSTAADPMIDPMVPRLELLKAFGVPKPKAALRDMKNDQMIAIRENDEWRSSGLIPDVKNTDNHMVHIPSHEAELRAAIAQPGQHPPQWLEALSNHLQDHMAIMQQIQGNAAGGAQLGPGGAGSGSALPQADAATEAQFSNAQRGAQEQGVV